ncbi:MAG TPA: PDZ domain-containing protein [Fimbriimonadaceae bacterium]|nr:PDZ domain-containing protein [Fimbriimonadaceae bacterium]
MIPVICLAVLSSQAVPPTASVPFRVSENAIIVDGAVNKRPVSLMFDTGFSASVNVGDNVDLGKPTGHMTLTDFVGSFEAATVKVTDLKVGAVSMDTSGLSDAILSRGDYSRVYGTHCDGVLGLECMAHRVLGINFEHSRFDFYPASMDISKWTPDNKKTFLVKLLPTGDNSLEMSVQTPTGKRMVMALDTGNGFYATTHRDVLARVGLWKDSETPQFMSESMVASGPVDSWSLLLKNMTIFGVPVPSGVWDIIDLPSATAEGDGTVGYGFLHNFNIIVDFERRRVWLENFTGKTADDPLGDVGLFALADRKSGDVKVFRVTPNSPAAKAGIKEGDTILSVGDDDLPKYIGYERMRKMLEGPVGSKVNLAISSDGGVKRYDLERVELYNQVGQ